jgi:hypothetical protein
MFNGGMSLEVIEETPSPQADPDFKPFGKSFRSFRSFIKDWPSGNRSWYGENSFNSGTAPSASISNQVYMKDVTDDVTIPTQKSKSVFAYCSESCWCWK